MSLVLQRLLYVIALLDLFVRTRFKQRWWHSITPHLYLGAIPLSNHLLQLKALGIKAVHAVLEDDEAQMKTLFTKPILAQHWAQENIAYRRLSCPDMTPMSSEELEASAHWVHMQISSGNPVYVHCKAGRGRSAMVVIAYLVRYAGMTFAQALHHVTAQRTIVRFRPSQLLRLTSL